MKVEILRECGYDEALLGLSLSYNRSVEEMPRVAEKLYCRDDSEAKFLRFITVWMDIIAPRYWWQQMSEYKVGCEWQSESTMHTILKRPLNDADFALPIGHDALVYLNDSIVQGLLVFAKNDLPEGFLQRRIVVTNYQTLRRIIRQRCHHKLPEWPQFCVQIMEQLEHQEFIDDLKPIEVYS